MADFDERLKPIRGRTGGIELDEMRRSNIGLPLYSVIDPSFRTYEKEDFALPRVV